MVILADAGQLMAHLNADAFKVRNRANARQKKQLWRMEDARCQDDRIGGNRFHGSGNEFNARYASSAYKQPCDQRVGDDR
jgi:hypothetical protein